MLCSPGVFSFGTFFDLIWPVVKFINSWVFPITPWSCFCRSCFAPASRTLPETLALDKRCYTSPTRQLEVWTNIKSMWQGALFSVLLPCWACSAISFKTLYILALATDGASSHRLHEVIQSGRVSFTIIKHQACGCGTPACPWSGGEQ